MDDLQATATSLAVIAIVICMVVFLCHFLGPKATAWMRSNQEEKIGLSKSKLFNANGYVIHSGSDFLLSSSGSFKRFDSVDRDFKQVSQSSLTSPAWNIPLNDIPPQPLRPAPAPIQFSTKCSEIHEKPIEQKIFNIDKENSKNTTVVPRPIVKRQFSTPIKSNNNGSCLNSDTTIINLSEAVEKIRNTSRVNTNPFLNGTLSLNSDNLINCDMTEKIYNETSLQIFEQKQEQQNNEEFINKCLSTPNKNPFTSDCILMQNEKNKEEENEEFNITNYKNSKTDIDRHNYFNFEPEKINAFLSLSTKQIPSQNILIPQETVENKCHEQQKIITMNMTNSTIEFYKQPKEKQQQQNKFSDSPCVDAFENIEKVLKKHFRNRSFSDTEATDPDLRTFANSSNYFRSHSTNPFLDRNSSILKTFSEEYLFRNNNNNNNNQFWNFPRTLPKQESSFSLGRRNSSQSSLDEKGSFESINLQRALSCDSVSSESSVLLSDLEQSTPQVTGYLCVGLQCDKNSITDDGMELLVTVMEAKELIGPPNSETFDTFVRIYLVPDETGAMQTKLFKNSTCPSYNETFCFWLNKKRIRHSLWFHLYHSGNAHTLIGEAEMQVCDVSRPITTWLPLSDSRQNNTNWGELMFSLSYLPTAERLTVVVVKARNLKLDNDEKETIDVQQNIFVKVYLLKNEKKVSKKRTSFKRTDRCPIFNESMIFSIPPYILNFIQVRLTVMSITDTEMTPIGHIIVGSNTTGKSLRHWHQMLSSLRKPVAMWHQLRKTIKKSKKTVV